MFTSAQALPRWRRLLLFATAITLVLAQFSVAEARPWGAVGRPSEVRYPTAPRVGCTTLENKAGTAMRVCYHWATSGSHAPGIPDDGDANTWPETVDQTRAALEAAWQSHILGAYPMRMPLPDGGSKFAQGPNVGFDIYLVALPDGELGYCDYDRRPDADGDGPSDPRADGGNGRIAAFCVIDSDFSAVPLAEREDELKATVAHEFHHALQYANDYGTPGWASEGSAVWSEGFVFPELDTTQRYLEDSALQNPDDPLDLSGGGYGAWLFWQFIQERQFNADPGFVRDFWTETRRRSDTRRESTAESLAVLGTATRATPANLLGAFGGWNYRVVAPAGSDGDTYQDADEYTVALDGRRPPADAVYQLGVARQSTDATGAPNVMRRITSARPSIHYIRLETPAGGPNLWVTVDFPPDTSARALVEFADGSYAMWDSRFTSAASEFATCAGCAVILVLSNAATSTRTMKYRATLVQP